VSDTRRRTKRKSAVICGVTCSALVEHAFFLFVLFLLFSIVVIKIYFTLLFLKSENEE